jgi:glycine cleavage system H protein
MSTVLYKRATFVTQLPTTHLYSHSHNWLRRTAQSPEGDTWQVGYTKFALRMLGELVDVQFEATANSPIQAGDVLGSIEGFKAISDIYSVGEGRFLRANPDLQGSLEAVIQRPYDTGWLYEFQGKPDTRILELDGYRGLLDATIDRMLEKQQQQEQ